MYILLEGSVEVSRKSEAQEVILAELKAATFFGEVALVDDGPRSATVRATSKCLVLRIGRDTLRILAGVQPAAAIHLLSAIGHSLVLLLRKSNQKYLDLLLSLQVPIDPEGKID